MSPGYVFLILWRRFWIVALTFVTAVGVATSILYFIPGRYDAIATATVDPGRSDPLSGFGGSSSGNLAMMQGNLVALVQSQRVALAVVKQIGIVTDPDVQREYRTSEAFGRIPIENWMADQLLLGVSASFTFGSNVMTIKYKSNSAIRSATIANAFLAAAIDAAIEMKAASGNQTALWFVPQIEALRNQLAAARVALQEYLRTNSMLVPGAGVDTESTQLTSVSQELATLKTALSALQSRYDSGSVELSNDPSDPDLQLLAGLKSKLTASQGDLDLSKSTLGGNNPRVAVLQTSIKAMQGQIDEETQKMREHLLHRIDNTKAQIKTLEDAHTKALREMIDVQGRREKLAELTRDVAFKQELLDAQEKAKAQAELQSKLTFSDIAVLDKAVPPATPAFPKPFIVLAVAIGAGLSLGLILALLAEALDRRVRSPEDLTFATASEVLGVVPYRRAPLRLRNARSAA